MQLSSHQNFGKDYNSLRNRARLAEGIDSPELSDSELAGRVKELSDERDGLNKKRSKSREGLSRKHERELKKVKLLTK